MKNMSQNLIELRKNYQFTQKQVAETLKMKENAYRHYEKGRSIPNIGCLIQLAELYHTSIEYIVRGNKLDNIYISRKITSFPKRLKEIRKRNHMTQLQLAKFLGLEEVSYQYYEYGAHEPKLENLIKLADLFQVTLDELLGRNET